jgi:broad specificity phosphatase PhoE
VAERSRVYLLRHGFSVWQETYDVTKVDPVVIDARLSARGWEQVQAAAATVAALQVELVVTSPLTRAIETALGVFGGVPSAPVIVHALLRERLGDSCDIGRSPAALAAEFPALDFAHLPETWWYQGELDSRGIAVEPRAEADSRAAQFRQWLDTRTENAILVVSHLGLLRRLGGAEIANGEVREMDWAGSVGQPV